ncbi:ADC synthase [Aspergillus varians]
MELGQLSWLELKGLFGDSIGKSIPVHVSSTRTFNTMGTLKVLIIDHYDSYTNNILQLLQGSVVDAAGQEYPEWSVAIVRFDQFSWDTFSTDILPSLDAIILSPGPGSPEREADFGFNSRLVREANVPILGICLGHQGIGTTFGAKIIHTPNIKHGQICQVLHKDIGVLRDLPQGFDAVRYNSLVLDFEDLPSDLEATAWTYDPEDASQKVLMGIQHKHRPIFGTQWHPESVCSTYGVQIVHNFRNVVLDFWAQRTPWNRWTTHEIVTKAALPKSIQDENVIKQAAQVAPSVPLGTPTPDEYPYVVKAATLGKGPSAQLVFQSLVKGTSADGEVWLDSAKVRDSHSRNSYLAPAAFALSYSSKTQSVSIYQNGAPLKSEKLQTTYWTWLDAFHQDIIQKNTETLASALLGQDPDVGQPLLQVGLLGYFGYELKRESLPGYTYTASPNQAAGQHSDSRLLFTNTVFRLDNYTGEWTVFGLIQKGPTDPVGEFINSPTKVGLSEAQFDAIIAQARGVFSTGSHLPSPTPEPLPPFTALDNEETYSETIRAAQQAIKEGETYELTLTTRFEATSPKANDPYALYLALRARNPAPYSAYVNFPSHDLSILSSSPERFISIDRDGVAEMKPIKGTLAVSPDPQEDERRKNQLATDVKELAENLMIVDLIRSDLHNISPSKSIKVPKLLHVESYETVHQLVTTIQSHIAPTIGSVKAIERCFPPGSMTGAPKLRSVQLLDGLEQHRERGIYSGSLGYLCASGSVDQSVVIRTIVRTGDKLELGAGGAITWLSEADKEWEEVLVKANAVAEAKPRVLSAPAAAASLAQRVVGGVSGEKRVVNVNRQSGGVPAKTLWRSLFNLFFHHVV